MWTLRIQDPSGETRKVPLKDRSILGKAENASIPLRDPTAPARAAEIWTIGGAHSPYWLRVPAEAPPVTLGDLEVRDARLPAGVPVAIGESQVTLEKEEESNAWPEQPSGFRHWLSSCEEGRNVLWTARKAAATPLSIYLAGETGTGKEVLAELVHAWSDRASGPFVPLHCGALPLSLAESELFGHVKGAYTGAAGHRAGALMQAHGGTLFLDEVGDLPLDIQVKILRFLENGEIRPVGSDRSSRADVRIVCATHHPLRKLVEEGKFRRDLYYRLASVTVDIPPLRARPEDIELLSRKFAEELGRQLTPKALLRLKAHAWPGNVRELRHALERASGLAGPFTTFLSEESFAFLMTPENVDQAPELELGAPVLSLEEMERVLLIRALRLSSGNRASAAKILGIARSTLFEMLKRHGIRGPKARRKAANESGGQQLKLLG